MKKRQNLVEKTYTTNDGLPAVVLIPDDETDLDTGIPVSLDLTALYVHMPIDFQQRLYTALHAQGLVKAKDYFAAGAADRFKAALLSVIRHDFLSAQKIAKQELNSNG